MKFYLLLCLPCLTLLASLLEVSCKKNHDGTAVQTSGHHKQIETRRTDGLIRNHTLSKSKRNNRQAAKNQRKRRSKNKRKNRRHAHLNNAASKSTSTITDNKKSEKLCVKGRESKIDNPKFCGNSTTKPKTDYKKRRGQKKAKKDEKKGRKRNAVVSTTTVSKRSLITETTTFASINSTTVSKKPKNGKQAMNDKSKMCCKTTVVNQATNKTKTSCKKCKKERNRRSMKNKRSAPSLDRYYFKGSSCVQQDTQTKVETMISDYLKCEESLQDPANHMNIPLIVHLTSDDCVRFNPPRETSSSKDKINCLSIPDPAYYQIFGLRGRYCKFFRQGADPIERNSKECNANGVTAGFLKKDKLCVKAYMTEFNRKMIEPVFYENMEDCKSGKATVQSKVAPVAQAASMSAKQNSVNDAVADYVILEPLEHQGSECNVLKKSANAGAKGSCTVAETHYLRTSEGCYRHDRAASGPAKRRRRRSQKNKRRNRRHKRSVRQPKNMQFGGKTYVADQLDECMNAGTEIRYAVDDKLNICGYKFVNKGDYTGNYANFESCYQAATSLRTFEADAGSNDNYPLILRTKSGKCWIYKAPRMSATREAMDCNSINDQPNYYGLGFNEKQRWSCFLYRKGALAKLLGNRTECAANGVTPGFYFNEIKKKCTHVYLTDFNKDQYESIFYKSSKQCFDERLGTKTRPPKKDYAIVEILDVEERCMLYQTSTSSPKIGQCKGANTRYLRTEEGCYHLDDGTAPVHKTRRRSTTVWEQRKIAHRRRRSHARVPKKTVQQKTRKGQQRSKPIKRPGKKIPSRKNTRHKRSSDDKEDNNENQIDETNFEGRRYVEEDNYQLCLDSGSKLRFELIKDDDYCRYRWLRQEDSDTGLFTTYEKCYMMINRDSENEYSTGDEDYDIESGEKVTDKPGRDEVNRNVDVEKDKESKMQPEKKEPIEETLKPIEETHNYKCSKSYCNKPMEVCWRDDGCSTYSSDCKTGVKDSEAATLNYKMQTFEQLNWKIYDCGKKQKYPINCKETSTLWDSDTVCSEAEATDKKLIGEVVYKECMKNCDNEVTNICRITTECSSCDHENALYKTDADSQGLSSEFNFPSDNVFASRKCTTIGGIYGFGATTTCKLDSKIDEAACLKDVSNCRVCTEKEAQEKELN